jgi:hypothetical protein
VLTDPRQTSNVARQYPDIIAELRGDLVSRLIEVGTAGEIIERWR